MLLPGFDRVDIGQHFIQRLVIEIGQRAKSVWPFLQPLPDLLWHFVGQNEQLLLVGFKSIRQPMNEGFTWVVTKVDTIIFVTSKYFIFYFNKFF